MASIFGFKFGREKEDPKRNQSFAQEENLDGSLEIAPIAGAYGAYLDIEGAVKNEAETITLYRQMAQFAECEYAIDDVVNEAIIMDEEKPPIEIVLDKVDASESIKKKIHDEFQEIVNLLDFKNQCYDIFRRWYVDGRLYFHMIIDVEAPVKGIQKLQYIDPRKIRKVQQKKRKEIAAKVGNDTVALQEEPNEYYLYNPAGLDKKGPGQNQGMKIAPDSISYTHSGLLDANKSMIISHLHKAIKPYNQLRMLEDALVIYRIARAPERRIFYVDVGNLPKIAAEQYIREIMVKFKNRVIYNSSTGEISDEREHRTMLEDYWLPRREGGRGTEISTLPGGQNLGDIEDVLYFRKKLFKAMNVPQSRLEQDTGFNIGRAAEITRDEVKFGKFVARLRLRFTHLFMNILSTQLRLKKIITEEDWKKFKSDIYFDWSKDTYFLELQQAEILQNRVTLLRDVNDFREDGRYFSKEWIQKNVLRQTEDEIKEIAKQLKAEEADPETKDDNANLHDNEDNSSNGSRDSDTNNTPKPKPKPVTSGSED